MNLCNGLFVYVYIITIVQKNNLKKQNLILLPSYMFSMKFSLHLDGFHTLHNEHKLLIFVASSMKPVAFLSPFFISCTSSMLRLLKRIFCKNMLWASTIFAKWINHVQFLLKWISLFDKTSLTNVDYGSTNKCNVRILWNFLKWRIEYKRK